MYLYAALLTGSIAVPLALSFDKKLQFRKQWKFLMPAIAAVGMIFIICDIYLANSGVWGFNPRYHTGLTVAGLPLEEWIFFLIIPYSSIFLHDALVLYFPGARLPDRTSKGLTLFVIMVLSLVIATHTEKTYTVYALSLTILALVITLFDTSGVIRNFYVTFWVILIPFTLVNAVLTGSFIDGEVVWYNDSENLGIRYFTMPVEDIGYGFSLILFSLLLRNKIRYVFTNRRIYNAT